MGDFRGIARQLLATIHPHAVVLDRSGNAVLNADEAPTLGDAFHDGLVRLDAGDEAFVVDGDGQSPGWRLLPIHEDERVTAVMAIPEQGPPSRPRKLTTHGVEPLTETSFVSLIADELATLSDTATIIVALVDTNYHFAFASRAYSQWFDLPPESIVGRHVSEILGERLFETVRPNMVEALRGTPIDLETEATFPGVGHKHVRTRYVPIRDAANRVAGFYALVFDLTPHASLQRALTRSERWLEAFFEESPVGMCILDEELRYTKVNPALARINGLSVEAHLGKTLRDLIPDAAAIMEPICGRVLATGKPRIERDVEIPVDGVVRTFSSSQFRLPGAEPGRWLLAVLVVETTEQRAVERALRTSEERFRVALENTNIVVFNQDLELRYTWVSQSCEASFEPVLGKRDEDLLTPEDATRIGRIKRAVIETGTGTRTELTLHVDGVERTYDLALEPQRNDSGKVIGITGVSTNITPMLETAKAQQAELERLVTERTEELARSETRLRAVLETASETIISIDRHGIIQSCNRAILDLLGYAPDEVVGRNVSMLIPKPEGLLHVDQHGRLATQGHPSGRGQEMCALSKHGERIPVRLQLAESDIDGEHLYVGVLQDRRHEELAREALRHRATLVDNMKDAVIATDLEMRIVTWSGGAEAIYGWRTDEVQGRVVSDVLGTKLDTTADQVREQLFREGSWHGEAKQRRKNGTWLTVSSHVTLVRGENGEPVGILGVNADVTALKELQARYAHAQKMEALGRLTAGIAHDFGNLLMGISGCAALALSAVDPDGVAARNLRALIEAVKRGTGLSRQLMSFSRKKGEPTIERLSLDAVVVTTRSLLERLIGDDIELTTDLACSDRRIQSDASQLEQLLVNLIINARDAMPEGGGRITVQTEEVEISDRDAQRRGLPSQGCYVRLTITDTGHGMDEATRARIFEPFFTTKEVGRGTGLGLSTVYAYVQEMGGGIEVDSQPGRGTSFLLYFPCSLARASGSTQTEMIIGGTETVLLVEDDDLVRLTVRHYLESFGYSVLEASRPFDALRRCEGSSERIDLLLSDVVMPEMGGRECARRARAFRPGLRVLFMSAHSQESLLARGSLQSGDDVLHKPFRRSELALAVRKALDSTIAPAREASPTARGCRVLVVDDAELTLLAISDFLQVCGHPTVVATTARQALAILEQDPDGFDVVLTDYTLPDIMGTVLAAKIRQRHPGMPIAYMSGFPRSHAGVGADEVWLQKPFELDEVIVAIQEVWSARRSSR